MPLNVAMRAGERPRIRNGLFLTGRTVGIHGCGNIGKEVVRLLQPFNCKILACDIKDYSDFYKQWNVTPVSFDELLGALGSPHAASAEDQADDRALFARRC